MSKSQTTHPHATSTQLSWINDMMAHVQPNRLSEFSISGTGDDVEVFWKPAPSCATDPFVHAAPSMVQPLSPTPGASSGKIRSLPVKRKRSKSSLDSDPLGVIVTRPHFARNLINGQQAKSAPAPEAQEAGGAAADRQMEVLSKIYGVLESRAKKRILKRRKMMVTELSAQHRKFLLGGKETAQAILKKAMNMSFDSRPSDSNDATDALLQAKSQTGNTTPSSHGKVEATDLLDKTPEANVADKPQDNLDLTSKLKLVVTPQRCFGHDLFNAQRGASVPAAPEAPRKQQKLAHAFEENLSLSVAGALLKVAGGIEAAIDRQTELLSLILDAMEHQGGSTSN
ncbi:hypothetical protein BD769DRAFT_1394387 [Suillus cothurnatus]|nr:hypothetical protein BD769DRAFT_1394387 [Suillus cothurnatus]